MIAAVVALPVIVLVAVAYGLQWLVSDAPLLLVTAVLVVAVVAYGAYSRSPLVVRSTHEREVLDLRARAEHQRAALPVSLTQSDLAAALERKGILLDGNVYRAMAVAAQSIWAEEFIRALPPMPAVPLEGERIYDIEYDKRTLRKGEEPPYRILRDAEGRPTTAEVEAYKLWLRRYVASTTKPEASVGYFISALLDCLGPALPHGAGNGTSGFGAIAIPLIDLVPDARAVVGHVLATLGQRKVREWHQLSTVRSALERNRERLSASTLRVRDLAVGAMLEPSAFVGSPRELIDGYLAECPLKDVFLSPVAVSIPTEKRFEGQLLVARSGAGKTNALECLIHRDLQEVAAGRASLVVMDSQGTAPDTLMGRLGALEAFSPGGALEGKLIFLEPDLEVPLALNIFDLGQRSFAHLSAAQSEDLVSSACEVVEFLFTGLLGGDLSDNMAMLYRYLVPAMLAIPNADMNTFIELLDVDAPRGEVPKGFQKHRVHWSALDPEVRSFLEQDYLTDMELVKTKAAVRRRLRAALADTTFRRMFTQPRNKLNLFDELQAGKVILVNTYPAKGYVEQFGRLILALLMQATRQRLDIEQELRLPTFVYIDECQDYIAREERIARYIDKCRKQHVALVFAHQRLANIESPRVLNALSGLSIKFSGGSDADPQELASMIGTTADHIRSLPRGTFAVTVSGIIPRAVDVVFPESPLKNAQRLSPTAFAQRRAEMRLRYGSPHPMAEPTPEPGPSEGSFVEQRALAPPRSGSEAPTDRPSPEDYDPLADT